MVQVKDNKVIQSYLPRAGVLSDGRSVSNYNELPIDILIAEGWLPTVDNNPTYDSTTQMLVIDSYTIQPTQVIINYTSIPIPTF